MILTTRSASAHAQGAARLRPCRPRRHPRRPEGPSSLGGGREASVLLATAPLLPRTRVMLRSRTRRDLRGGSEDPLPTRRTCFRRGVRIPPRGIRRVKRVRSASRGRFRQTPMWPKFQESRNVMTRSRCARATESVLRCSKTLVKPDQRSAVRHHSPRIRAASSRRGVRIPLGGIRREAHVVRDEEGNCGFREASVILATGSASAHAQGAARLAPCRPRRQSRRPSAPGGPIVLGWRTRSVGASGDRSASAEDAGHAAVAHAP